MNLNESEILFVSGDYCLPYIFITQLRCSNKNNEYHWAIVDIRENILALDLMESRIRWASQSFVLSDSNPVFGKQRLQGTFKTKNEAKQLLVDYLIKNPDMGMPWLFEYSWSEANITQRENLLKG